MKKEFTVQDASAVADYVKSHWGYNPMTGIVTGRGGRPIGRTRPDGGLHCTVRIPKAGVMTAVLLHRAAWLIVTGSWPNHGVDHRDGDRSNNKWANLRPATQSQNRQNLKPVTGNGVLRGCTRYYRKWKAQIKVPGERAPRYLGLFATQEEAHAAYCAAKAALHPFQPIQRQ